MSDTIRFYSNISPLDSGTNTTIGQFISNGTYITPPMIANYYGIPASSGANVKVGIISLGGGFNQSDLNSSFSDLYNSGQLSTNIPPTINFISVPSGHTNPGYTGNGADGENTLDIYCVSTIVPSAIINFYSGNSYSNFPDAINQAVTDNCDVISISWGYAESQFASAFGTTISNMELAFANASAKGITVLVASGDNGSEPSNSGGLPEGVQYPASSANVIAVGGTYMSQSAGIITAEYAAQNSGGGVSGIIPLPTWQQGIQATPYFTANSSYGTPFTISNRGVPDIAAPFWNYIMYLGSAIYVERGTSAACPVMAGIIARYISLNGGRRPVKGASTLNTGFYANINAFYNSTFNGVYYNGGTATTTDVSDPTINGYKAIANQWDPITGLGRPIGQSVYEIATSNGTKVKTAANTWSYVANVKVKTAANTWSNVRSIYTKTVNGWQQTF
jgi:kumamolisin